MEQCYKIKIAVYILTRAIWFIGVLHIISRGRTRQNGKI